MSNSYSTQTDNFCVSHEKKLNIGDIDFSDFILKPTSPYKPQLNDVDFDRQKSGLDHYP